MTNKELQALRLLFNLTVSEASEHIAKLKSSRSWQHWESGKYSVKEDVADFMLKLADARMTTIEKIENELSKNKKLSLNYYMTFREYSLDYPSGTVIDWRISNSISAYFFAEGLVDIS